ncbi:MAG TPA: RidA family protein [Acidimicrobiales bacterium]|nr:RidA family protein [Acidimicrobiales bacterium]
MTRDQGIGGGSGSAPRAWPPTRSSADLLFVSGQLALDDEGNLVGRSQWDVQARQCLRRIDQELQHYGAGMGDVVRLTSYLVDAAGYAAYAQARQELYPDLHASGTSVVVAGLLVEGALLEVEATAVRPGRRATAAQPGSEPNRSGRQPGEDP